MKKKGFTFGGLPLLFGLMSTFAQALPSVPGDITLPDNFLINALQPILQKVGIFIGGIFGLYVLLTLVQVYNERKKVRLLKDIRNDLDLLTKHFGVKHSHEKNGILRKLFGFLLPQKETEKKPKK